VTRENSKLKRWNSLSELAKKMREQPSKAPASKRQERENESENESESESSSDNDSDSEESDKEVGGIPKEKLAGRAPVAKKRKSGGLRAMFS